jgi:predicted enzyme related to lactoylglutathione lyase
MESIIMKGVYETMLEGLNFIILNASDIEQAKTFYTEKLGFQIENASPGFVQFKQADPGATFALQKVDSSSPYDGVELWWQVSDADAVYSQLLERGVTVVSPPTDEPFGRAMSIQDPGGNKLNIYQLPAGR